MQKWSSNDCAGYSDHFDTKYANVSIKVIFCSLCHPPNFNFFMPPFSKKNKGWHFVSLRREALLRILKAPYVTKTCPYKKGVNWIPFLTKTNAFLSVKTCLCNLGGHVTTTLSAKTCLNKKECWKATHFTKTNASIFTKTCLNCPLCCQDMSL